jgi:basic membrane lipoprotein Med (substrate-binding protein (PBP1-ABC) superfamily)
MRKISVLFALMMIAAMALTACGGAAPTAAPTQAAAAEPFKVAVILPSAINDVAFSQSMYDALVAVQNEMGSDKFEFKYSDNMFVVDDAAAAIRDYASQGYDLVIAHGSQYGSSLQDIAPDFPNTSFAWGTTVDTFKDKGINNVFAYEARTEQGGYVNGVMAAMLSKSGTLGLVEPIETGDAKLYAEGFTLGAQSVNPNVEIKTTWTGSFSDVGLASQAATAEINAGADVLSGTAQMVTGAISVAKDNNIPWFANDADQSSIAPNLVVASQVYHWETVIDQMISLIKSGTLGGQSFSVTLANGGEVMVFNPDYNLPADVKAAADQTISGINDGSITINLPTE